MEWKAVMNTNCWNGLLEKFKWNGESNEILSIIVGSIIMWSGWGGQM